MRMYGRKNALRIMILSIGALLLAGCGEEQSEQPETGTFGTETIEISDDMATGQPGESAAEVLAEQSEESAAEPSESEEDTSPEQTKCSVPTLPATGCELSDFVAEGWELLDCVELDYNGDGITDYVGVLQMADQEIDGWWYYSPGFRILFAIVSEGPGQYRLDFQDENLIRTREEGGVYGDPYEPLTAEGTSFTTHAFGGSAWKWSEAYTYTYKEGTWYLTRSETDYGYGPYTTDYAKNDWERGIRTQRKRSTSFSDMEQHWEEDDILEDDGIYDLEYEMRLDEPLTLYQAGKRWWLAPDRVTDWEVRRIVFAEGIELSQELIKAPETVHLKDYCDENCVLYTFSCGGQDDQGKRYLAMYRWQDNSLYVLAEEDSPIDDVEVYGDKIYYSTEVVKHIAYKSVVKGENLVKEEDEGIGVRLNRINMDGTGKEIVFEYLYPGTDQQILEDRPPYMSLITDISGGEAVIEVYIGSNPHPVYRMNVDGSDLRQIGQIPRE